MRKYGEKHDNLTTKKTRIIKNFGLCKSRDFHKIKSLYQGLEYMTNQKHVRLFVNPLCVNC
jgi:hypothetical protein